MILSGETFGLCCITQVVELKFDYLSFSWLNRLL